MTHEGNQEDQADEMNGRHEETSQTFMDTKKKKLYEDILKVAIEMQKRKWRLNIAGN